jgi:hypothetical protein
MRACIRSTGLAYHARFLGTQLSVLWESVTEFEPEHWIISGLTDNYLRVTTHARQEIWNEITPVYIRGMNNDGLIAEIQ